MPARDVVRARKVATLACAAPLTLLSYKRLSALYDLGTSLAHEGVPGAIAECGLWNGGSAAVIADAFRRNGSPRETWLFDSWEGLPEPAEVDISSDGTRRQKDSNLGSERAVEGVFFQRFRFERQHVHLSKGWFEDTLQVFAAQRRTLAMLHLDSDWYSSVRLSLGELYDVVVPDGIVAVDDYGYWEGSRKAVEEFLAERDLPRPFASVGSAAYLRKPDVSSLHG